MHCTCAVFITCIICPVIWRMTDAPFWSVLAQIALPQVPRLNVHESRADCPEITAVFTGLSGIAAAVKPTAVDAIGRERFLFA